MTEMMKPVLSAVDVAKRFGAVEVLKGISLEAAAGDVIAMIGASGQGKAPSCAASTCWSGRRAGASSSPARS